ncbi:MAG: hypothetical protein ACI4L7_00070 [Christensenellales bacterium]
MLDTFLNILGVIGIIVVAAFIIVFLSDLFISIVDGTNGIFFKRHKQSEDKPVTRPKLLNAPNEEQERPVVKPVQQEQPAEQPAPQVAEQPAKEEPETPSEVDMEQAKAEEEALKASNLQPQQPIVVPVEEEDLDSIVSEITEETKKVVAQMDEEKKSQQELDEAKKNAEDAMSQAQEAQKQAEDAQKQAEDAENRQKELEERIAELEKQIEDDQKTIKDLEEKSAEQPATVSVQTASKEELQQRLEVLKQRLKENEKELSANKKEFLPLRRVNMTLDSDKRKLRRKEAIVAKQKVVLYGVNNYVDIDEEKANKLTQELDLLEGLRLSVQHCEEVMQKNKDRYPILERANAFLNKNHDELKSDIAELEEKIRLIEEQQAQEAEQEEKADTTETEVKETATDNGNDDNSTNN